VVFIGLLAVIGALLSATPVRKALPFDSLLAFGAAVVCCVVLFQLGRIG
jgi:hypothetical protein